MKKNSKGLNIIKVGYELFDKKGYNGTGISDIIAKAGIPKGSFYYYFKNKEEFALSVIDYYSSAVIADINQKLLDKKYKPRRRIINLYTEYVYCIENNIEIPYSDFACKLAQEVGHVLPSIKEASNNVFVLIRDAHTNCIAKAKELNSLKNDIEAEKLAELIIYAWEGVNLRSKGSDTNKCLIDFISMLDKVIL